MMRRWLCSLLLAVGVAFLTWISYRSVCLHAHPHTAVDRSVVRQNEFASTVCRAWRGVNLAFLQSRAGPSEFSATEFAFLIAGIADDDPPRLDYRGPPRMCAVKVGLLLARLPARLAAKRRALPSEIRAS